MTHYIRYEAWTFTADQIKGGNVYLATSLLSSSLEVNILIAVVECDEPSILDFERNTKLLYYQKPEQPMTFRVQNIERIAPRLYRITATSTLGLLSEGLHYGGIYDGVEAGEIIVSICGTVAVSVKSSIAKIKLYGWLPIAAPRDNLAQVLLATGAALKTDLDGVLRIETLWDGISGAVYADDLYDDSTVAYTSPITAVVVTEHQYIRGQEEKNLFEGTTLEGDIITFNEPMHSLTADGFTILESGDNWAKLSAGTGVLTGKAYIHNTREVTRAVRTAKDPNIKTVKDATLVSLVNSNAVANRLVNYYKLRETVNAAAVYHGEQPGDRLSMFHPFDRAYTDVCLQSADITLSNTLKAEEKGLVGFVPEQFEALELYDYREVLTGSGTWIPPEGATKVIAILIGGGGGGKDGEGTYSSGVSYIRNYGSDRKTLNIADASIGSSISGNVSNSYSNDGAAAEKGKKGGAGGTPGKVYRVELSMDGITGIPYSCGAKGTSGKNGGATVFGNETSDLGGTIPGGYVDIMTGEIFAVPGKAGSSGGDGGAVGSAGSSVEGVQGGSGVSSKSKSYGPYNFAVQSTSTSSIIDQTFIGTGNNSGDASFSGLGGGGAGGNSGENKGNPGKSGDATGLAFSHGGQMGGLQSFYHHELWLVVEGKYSGRGGSGANGAAGKTYGSGGDGGGGAGGAGAVGRIQIRAAESVTLEKKKYESKNLSIAVRADIAPPSVFVPYPTGGTGGDGAPGCIILYYGVKKQVGSGQLQGKNGKFILDKFGRRIIV